MSSNLVINIYIGRNGSEFRGKFSYSAEAGFIGFLWIKTTS